MRESVLVEDERTDERCAEDEDGGGEPHVSKTSQTSTVNMSSYRQTVTDDRVVKCGNCDHRLHEPPSLPSHEREPCPECGSISRRFEFRVEPAVFRIVGAPLAMEIRRTYAEHSFRFLVVLGVLTLASGLLGGFVVSGLAAFVVSVGFAVASVFVGFRALTRVREIERTH